MTFFKFGVATEANNYEEIDKEDEIWICNNNGELILVEDVNYENDTIQE